MGTMIVHELSWSTSRARTFATCRRKYYYDYYLSWLGWGRDAEPDRRRAYLLKKMTRMPMLAGDIVHRAIARYYSERDQGSTWDANEAIAWATRELRRGYKESRDGGWRARPARSVRLAEHHYDEANIDEESGAATSYGRRFVERIETCLRAFFEMDQIASVREAEPGDWLACEEMSTFELFETKVFAIPDFAYLERAKATDDSDRVRIIDWKTGRPSDADRFQLEVYAFYAREKWGVAPELTLACDVYLADREVVDVEFEVGDAEGTLARIESSMRTMRELHFDADEGVGDETDFPRVPEEDASRHCSSCNYRELCDRV